MCAMMRYESLFECAISGTYANSAVIPQHRPSASSRLWPARPAAICLPDACGLGCDSHGSKDFSGKLLEFLTQTGSERVLGYTFGRRLRNRGTKEDDSEDRSWQSLVTWLLLFT